MFTSGRWMSRVVRRSFHSFSIHRQATSSLHQPILPALVEAHAECLVFPSSLGREGSFEMTQRLQCLYAMDTEKWNSAWSIYTEMKQKNQLKHITASDMGRLMDAVLRHKIEMLNDQDPLKIIEELYQDVHNMGLVPDGSIQRALLEAYAQVGHIEQVTSLAQGMNGASTSREAAACRLPLAYIQAGQVDKEHLGALERKAVEEIEKNLKQGVESGKVTTVPKAGSAFRRRVQTMAVHKLYNPILAAFGKAGQEDKMVAYFNRLVKSRVADMFTFSTMISHYSNARQFEKAEDYIKQLEKQVQGKWINTRYEKVRTMRAYSHYLLNLASVGEYQKAYDFIIQKKAEMRRHCKASQFVELSCLANISSISPEIKQHAALFLLISWASKKWAFKLSMYSDLLTIFGPEAASLFLTDKQGDTLLNAHFKETEMMLQDDEDAVAAKKRMEALAEKHVIYSESISHLIQAYAYFGDIVGAQAILDYAIKSGFNVSSCCYESLVMACYSKPDEKWKEQGDLLRKELKEDAGYVPSTGFLNFMAAHQ